MIGRRGYSTRPPRPRSVWFALGTGVIVSIVIVVGVLLPILTVIGAADGGTAGALDVPVGQIVVALLIGYVLALALLALIVRVRHGALAWVLAVAAVISTLAVSVWPIVAVAISAVGQVSDIIPFIVGLVGRYWPGA